MFSNEGPLHHICRKFSVTQRGSRIPFLILNFHLQFLSCIVSFSVCPSQQDPITTYSDRLHLLCLTLSYGLFSLKLSIYGSLYGHGGDERERERGGDVVGEGSELNWYWKLRFL